MEIWGILNAAPPIIHKDIFLCISVTNDKSTLNQKKYILNILNSYGDIGIQNISKQ